MTRKEKPCRPISSLKDPRLLHRCREIRCLSGPFPAPDMERGHFDKTALAWAKSAGFTAEGSLLLAPTRHGKLAGRPVRLG
jgi:hypothetical protein